ncbi:MAG: methyltransferase domain-containing protein [Planctomycetes bacterium]|nr:methyltransferase domain-containing protein [Planctomycetota bacterium]
MSHSPTTPKPIAYLAYQKLADHFDAHLATKPHNAYYERPAMVAIWPELRGKHVLDAGCGPGLYAALLLQRGAIVTAIDVSDRMLELARKRLGPETNLQRVDLSQPMQMFADASFDFINAPLCLDYIEDWRALFLEFHRILRPGGGVQFSCGHPSFDAEYYRTQRYFSVEHVECTWTGFGKPVVMPSFRRSLQETIMPLLEAGFQIRRIVEPLPTEDFARSDPKKYESLMHRPAFLCMQATRS